MARRLIAILFLVIPAVLSAQAKPKKPVSLLVGVGLQNGEQNYGPGIPFGARFSAYQESWFAVRFDLEYAAFGQIGTYVTTPGCPVPGCVSTGDRVKILDASAHVAAMRSNGFAWTAGLGLYHLFETPHDGSYTRAGWNAGWTTGMHRSAYFDARYHGLLGPRTTTRGFLSLSLGIIL